MTVDREKIRQKLHFIRSELRELHRLQRMSEGEFKKNSIYPAAAARMLNDFRPFISEVVRRYLQPE